MDYETSDDRQFEHNRIEYWAYRSWQNRGSPVGSPDHDWFAAEQELRRWEKDEPQSVRLSHVPAKTVENERISDDGGARA